MTRLNLWDFDDTLVASNQVVERLARQHPEVDASAWWRDARYARVALAETKPFPTMWRLMARTPGKHVLFSGRVPAAVDEWLEAHADDPDVTPGLAVLDGSIPVPQFRQAGERIPDVKLRLIRDLVREHDVHLYDDHVDLPAMVAKAKIDGLTLHPVAHGHLLNGRRTCGCGGHASDWAA